MIAIGENEHVRAITVIPTYYETSAAVLTQEEVLLESFLQLLSRECSPPSCKLNPWHVMKQFVNS
jgi:hypothetical protein